MSTSSAALDIPDESEDGSEPSRGSLPARAPGRLPAPAPAAAPATHSREANYRPDIDGLRAVAVTLAVLFHLDAVGSLRGGFVGVDVFFVISGFLITRILLRAIGSGEMTLGWFYERRVRRIVPALLVVIAACLVGGWFLLLPGDYRESGERPPVG